jgi:uncharacterized protein YydD (DUF2326 family)
MKLSKLYSNKETFKEVKFNDGFNIIIGKVDNVDDSKSNTHNLGKTFLIYVIDFMLLKKIDKRSIFKKREDKFYDHIFFLELKLNNGKYLTIKRSIANNTKISLKSHDQQYSDFKDENSWSYEDLSITSKNINKGAIPILNQLLGFDVLKQYKYRNTVGYFLRAQQDYDDVFKLQKYAGKDKEWKPLLFNLFDMDGDLLYSKYTLKESLTKKNELVKDIQENFSFQSEDLDKINGLIQSKIIERDEIKSTIDKFNFYALENDISQEIVENVEEEVSRLNSINYKKRYELNQINKSLGTNKTFNVNEIEKIFNETKIYFPDQLKHSYEELIEFNKDITEERSKYLTTRKEQLEKDISNNNKELSILNVKRSELLSVIKNADSFKKFKEHQKSIIKIEEEIATLNAQTENLDVVKQLKNDIRSVNEDIDKKELDIDTAIENGSELYNLIRDTFVKLTRKIIQISGIISIRQNDEGNVEFEYDVAEIDGNTLTSKGEGFTYKKVLCACFDLSILLNYSDKSFFRFVYHDGVIESYDNRLKLNYLELMHNLCDSNDIQYIMTLIEHECPTDSNGKRIEFPDNEIVLTLTDEKGNKGKLFGFEF